MSNDTKDVCEKLKKPWVLGIWRFVGTKDVCEKLKKNQWVFDGFKDKMLVFIKFQHVPKSKC